jgi:hypothetical protein
LLKGTIEMSNYNNYGYNGAEETHYSFTINDGLRQQLLSADGPVKGLFTVVLLSRRYCASAGHPGTLLVELLDYRVE